MANETPSGPFDFIELRRSVPIFPVAIASVSISIALLPNQLGVGFHHFTRKDALRIEIDSRNSKILKI